MTTQNKNVPDLRFPEFSDEWKEKKLVEVSKINPSNQSLPDSFVYIDLESVENGILTKENQINLTGAPSRAQRLLEKNDILYQTVRPYQKNNLFFDRNGTYVASTGYAQIRTENNPRYLFQYLHPDYFVDKVLLRCTGTSYPAINSTDLSTIKLNIPTLPEQQKNAAFLTAIDEKIQQLARKKDLLEQYKKGVMQKIFNQEIRFKDSGRNDFADWEEKNLGDVCKIYDGTHMTPDYKESGIPFYSVEHVTANNFTQTKFIAEEIYEKENKRVKLEKGDIFMTRIGDIGTSKYISWDVKASFYVTLALLKQSEVKELPIRF